MKKEEGDGGGGGKWRRRREMEKEEEKFAKCFLTGQQEICLEDISKPVHHRHKDMKKKKERDLVNREGKG